jgi:hypothetical protein
MMRLDTTTPEREFKRRYCMGLYAACRGNVSQMAKRARRQRTAVREWIARIRTAWLVCAITFDCTATSRCRHPDISVAYLQHAQSGNIVVTPLPKSGACRAGVMYRAFQFKTDRLHEYRHLITAAVTGKIYISKEAR